ncbi:pigment biosynthesis-related tyrosinase [Mesorhizobium huakuii]|uniref:tyrosinase family protein n=1 Tax=Mesorhizobium huakuii TaxID=28104 RepID=UPI00235D96BB|nr:tyrosinase family protein [Mesorhizobium huakuii]GLQ82766.1 pigment biosynthesis-related tyrosinase [Mesorhizobium huakuii]
MALRIRRALEDIQSDYLAGSTRELDDLMRAWKGIKELPPDDPNSFFMIGGYHGEPFRGAGWGSSAYWGGYCNHGNVLFPTWHRAYLMRLEDALRSIPGCADVALPYWDETGEASLTKGVPWALTNETYSLDGNTIPNPLKSFVFTRKIVDHLSPFPDTDYSKPEGYETVRYPLSGLVGTDADRAATAAHNAQYTDKARNVQLLNANVVDWLTSTVIVNGTPVSTNSVLYKYVRCLEAPNFTVFSNTTSQQEWRDTTGEPVVSLESPHNSIHLAVGGYDLPKIMDVSPISGANGDMGENDTAGLDPIFFFHHCFVDRVFWLWQQKHEATNHLEIIPQYPGTNSVDSQGPTPGVSPNSWLTLESPLNPFCLKDSHGERPYTSLDCINIETQMGYTYGEGSIPALPAAFAEASMGTQDIRVAGINRASIRGSFLVSAFATINGKRHLVGTEAILSRWNVDGCANCQTHVEAKAFLGLHPLMTSAAQDTMLEIEVRTRDGILKGPPAPPGGPRKLFKFEVR